MRDNATRFQIVLRERFLSGADPNVCNLALSSFMREVAWVHLRGGEALFRQGDPSTGLFIVVSGRLRAMAEPPNGAAKVLNDIAAGESIGEMGLFTGSPRSASIIALRDTCLAALSYDSFMRIAASHPQFLISLGREVVGRLHRHELESPSRGVSTIAVVPISPGVEVHGFAESLVQALSALGPAAAIPAAEADAYFGCGVANSPESDPQGNLVSSWLNDLEDSFRFVVFKAGKPASAWTRRCLRHADAILLVAAASDPCPAEPLPDFLVAPSQTAGQAPRTLVLLHPPDCRMPKNTAAWLAFTAADRHYHLRVGSEPDVARLARSLAGCSVGLALGGGGARGLAHIGMIRALQEAGIPIDAVGGTSMGAAIGAACALAYSPAEMAHLLWERLFRRKPFQRYTLPLISLVNDYQLEQAMFEFVGDLNIEDLWLPYFCVSANLTTSQLHIHRTGVLRKAVRASVSLPGVLAPVVEGDNLLVDGGVLDVLPGDIMRELFGGAVIVADVQSSSGLRCQSPRMPSPWDVLKSWVFKGRGSTKVPGILNILMAANNVSSKEHATRVSQKADLCLAPPVGKFGLLAFDDRNQIIQTGYVYASRRLAELQRTGSASHILNQFLNRPAPAPAPAAPRPELVNIA